MSLIFIAIFLFSVHARGRVINVTALEHRINKALVHLRDQLKGKTQLERCNDCGTYWAIQNKDFRANGTIGYRDGVKSIPAKLTDEVPIGSITKPFVALAILRLLDSNRLRLNDSFVDTVRPKFKTMFPLHPLNFEDAFNPIDAYEKITIGELGFMAAGVSDYDYQGLNRYFKQHPYHGLLPFDILQGSNGIWASQEFAFQPPGGNKRSYSSISYMLLGLVIAAMSSKPWNETSPLDWLPKSFNRTGVTFPIVANCSQYKNVPHLYSFSYPFLSPDWTTPVDVLNYSCARGWMFGNLLISAPTAARFAFELYHPNSTLLSHNAWQKVVNPKWGIWSTPGWVSDFNQYGFGNEICNITEASHQGYPELVPENGFPNGYIRIHGHNGEGWGSRGKMQYFEGFDISMALLTNFEQYSSAQCVKRYRRCIVAREALLASNAPDDMRKQIRECPDIFSETYCGPHE